MSVDNSRQGILKRFREQIARGEPIIGGGAGTGLSAKSEEAGGIDLLIVYNSGRYRMAGRGSSAGLLAYVLFGVPALWRVLIPPGRAAARVSRGSARVLRKCRRNPIRTRGAIQPDAVLERSCEFQFAHNRRLARLLWSDRCEAFHEEAQHSARNRCPDW